MKAQSHVSDNTARIATAQHEPVQRAQWLNTLVPVKDPSRPRAPREVNDPSHGCISGITGDEDRRGIGLIVADLNLTLIYTSSAATSILQYPAQPGAIASRTIVQERIRSILPTDGFNTESSSQDFVSGRRRYVCRPFLVESLDHGSRPPIVALTLERRPRDPLVLAEVGRRFHLSPREIETVQHLIHGLTTKEAAQRMKISPNTVKQFVRLIMSKMNVSTRSGIIGRLVETNRSGQ